MAMDYIWLSDKLKDGYKEVFSKAEVYAGVRNIGGDTLNDMMMDLLDLLLTAQDEGKPVEKVVGPDIEKFCGAYFSNYTIKNHLLEIPKYLYRLMWLVFVFELITTFVMMSEGAFELFQATTDMAGYFLGFVEAWLVVFLCNLLIRPFMFRWKWLTSGVYYAIVLVLTGVLLFIGLWILGDRNLRMPIFPVLVISGGYILIYFVIRSVRRYRHHGSIRKEREPFEKSGAKRFCQQVQEELPEELLKRYDKKNKKLVRKGKQPVSPEEYLELLKKENARNRRGDKIGMLLVGLVVLSLVIQTALTSEPLDTLLFIVVILVAEIPAMFLFRVGRKSTIYREQIVEDCERRGITITEYVEGAKKDEIHDSTGSGND